MLIDFQLTVTMLMRVDHKVVHPKQVSSRKESVSCFIMQPASFLLVISVAVYNLNKYYLRYLPMDNQAFRLVTDVLPNFMIVMVFFSMVSLVTKKSAIRYGCLLLFCALLWLEEYTAPFGMSKVSDVNDSLASCAALIMIISIQETKRAIQRSSVRYSTHR